MVLLRGFAVDQNGRIVVVLGVGIAIGATISFVIHRLATRRLSVQLEEIYRELRELKTLIVEKDKRRSKRIFGASDHSSPFTSPGDSDEEFIEAPEFNELFLNTNSSQGFHPLSNNDTDIHLFSSGVDVGDQLRWNGSLDDLLVKVDHMFESTNADKEKAYQIMKSAYSRFSGKAEYLWRISKASFLASQIEAEKGLQGVEKELVFQATDFAENALKLNPQSSDVHKWYAITLGRRCDYESINDRIKHGYLFKDHINKAIELNPQDPSSYHLLGRWCYGVYQLSWFERKAAAALFSEPPSSTVDDALKNFMEAEKRKPGKWKENMLFIAKCFIEKSMYKDAVMWLDKAKVLPVKTVDDKESHTEITKLLYDYSTYRGN